MAWTYTAVALLFFAMTWCTRVSDACPNTCICKWKNGKQTVECTGKHLLLIPEGIDSGTQVLEFSRNNLHALQKDKFLSLGLIHLQRIYLSNCRITSIDDRTFKGLTNLVELDLAANLLDSIPSATFVDCPSLMRLTLNSNPIKVIRTAAFSHLSFLNTLELSQCEIAAIEEEAFLGLNHLEWLRLDGNKMSSFGSRRILPDYLRGIELQGNPWTCDCQLRELHSWLQSFMISHSAEPVCASPAKYAGRTVKSISGGELACLPDVSPTSFYLEIGEGKNISLLCQINAVPEAKVSWWFQGQTLQNDTLVGTDMRFLYFIEEGAEDKRSELFIYNANSQDNGTFVCSAENPAGTIYSNFTIRVILKEEPHEEVIALPFEFVIIIMSAAGVSVLVILFAIILSVVKCHRSSADHQKYKDNDKLSSLNNSTKDSLLQESIEEYSDLSKESSNVTLVDRQQLMFYGTHSNEDILCTMSPAMMTGGNHHVRSPTLSMRRYQLEQNPDLINDTESVGRRREADGGEDDMSAHIKETANFELSSVILPPHSFMQQDNDLYRFSADVHLNPVGLLTTSNNGGIPAPFSGHCYRTLPYNRGLAKRQLSSGTAANLQIGGRYSREAEFLSLSAQPASFEHYSADIRYTADGYPVKTPATADNADALEETTFAEEGSVRSCCSAPPVRWPPYISRPASTSAEEPMPLKPILKKCVGAQTQTDAALDISGLAAKPVNKSVATVKISETLTESPDEGYGGDVTDTSANTC